jgi:hypothetical protein
MGKFKFSLIYTHTTGTLSQTKVWEGLKASATNIKIIYNLQLKNISTNPNPYKE